MKSTTKKLFVFAVIVVMALLAAQIPRIQEAINFQSFQEELQYCKRILLQSYDPQLPATINSINDKQYRIVDWSNHADILESNSSYVPYVFDASLENHGGLGINILLADGRVIWDERAEWLNDFVGRHPDLRIKLPEE